MGFAWPDEPIASNEKWKNKKIMLNRALRQISAVHENECEVYRCNSMLEGRNNKSHDHCGDWEITNAE